MGEMYCGRTLIKESVKKEKFSRYRPEQALRDPEVKASGFSRLSAI
jgi:hypothetical protein